MLLGALAVPASLFWDFAWESTIGIDLLFAPPHVATDLAVVGICAGALAQVARATRERPRGGELRRGVALGRFRAPAGAWLALWGGLAFATALIFDRWWQQGYGLAAGIWHPPQILKAMAFFALLAGVFWFWVGNQSRPRGALAFSLAGGALLALITVVTLPSTFANRQHSAFFFQLGCATYPIVLVALARAGRLRFAATTGALAALGLQALLVWILPLVPGEPAVGPIYHARDHLLPPPFPLLLVIPALAIDALLHRLPGRVLETGVVFAALFVATQWFFAEFLLSTAADSWFFAGGGRHWPFFLRIDPAATTAFWHTPDEAFTLAGAGIAVLLAVLATGFGLGLGAGMKRTSLAILLLSTLASDAHAHVGSPNVFFEGHAGANAVTVVIRPPPTLPGVAQMDVRVADADVTRVDVRAAFDQAGAAAAPALTPAVSVAGDPRLWSASVWLLRRGTYAIQVEVESPRGAGRVTVPLQASALTRPVMSPALAATLIALGIGLCASAIALAAAVAASGGDRARGRVAGIATALVLVAALTGFGLRWRAMDRAFGNALDRPLPVNASIDRTNPLPLLRLEPVSGGAPGSSWDTLVTDHGKLMHLFLVREPALDAFAHLHPVRRDARRFEAVLPPLPAGAYELYAELTHEDGSTRTLIAKVALPEPVETGLALFQTTTGDGWCLSGVAPAAATADAPVALDADDSWHMSRATPGLASPLMDGGRMVFASDDPLVADRETTLRFAAFDAAGQPVELDPYMGMLGHAVVRRSDGGVFVHLHPMGTISMAAVARLENPDAPAAMPPPAAAREVVFPYAFPRAGEYRIWVQVRTRGSAGVLTGVFDVSVRDAT
jgi:hypothetical protein